MISSALLITEYASLSKYQGAEGCFYQGPPSFWKESEGSSGSVGFLHSSSRMFDSSSISIADSRDLFKGFAVVDLVVTTMRHGQLNQLYGRAFDARREWTFHLCHIPFHWPKLNAHQFLTVTRYRYCFHFFELLRPTSFRDPSTCSFEMKA